MKNLTDLPEENSEQIREKLHCYLAEKKRIIDFINLLKLRIVNIDDLSHQLIQKSAEKVMKREGISPVKLSLK